VITGGMFEVVMLAMVLVIVVALCCEEDFWP